MTILMVLLLPLTALIVWLLWKGSSLMVKITLLVLPLIVLIGWFAHEGAFRGGSLEDLYASVFIAAFLLLYEAGMLIHYLYLSRNGIK